MEKELPSFDTVTLDSLIYLLDSPEELKQKIDELEHASHPLSDEVDGFILYYKLYNGDSEKIKQQLKKLETNFVIAKPKKRMVILGWAAIFMLILGSSITYYLVQSYNNQQITTPYEEIGLANYMGENEKNDLTWNSIMYKYKNKQFQHIIDLTNPTKNDTLYYFQGISAFKLAQFKNSIHFFNHIDKTSVFYNKSLYFKTIDLFNLEQMSTFHKTLSEIKPDKNDPDFNQKLEALRRLK